MMKCLNCGGELIDYGDGMNGYYFCKDCGAEFEERDIIEHYESQGEEKEESEGDKLVSLSAIIQALENEIEWSKGNVNLAPTQDAADWFIKGLEQAKWLIPELSKIDHQEEEVVTLLIISDSNFDDAVISALPEQIREALDCAQTPDHKSASVWVALLSEVALEECESILSKRGIKYLLAYPGEAEIKAHPENYGKPGWMGDYGGIPHGPFDV